jgi:hypothetical protein
MRPVLKNDTLANSFAGNSVFRSDAKVCRFAVPSWDVTEVISGQVTGRFGDVTTLCG